MDGLAESLRRSPELFPHSFDVDRDSVSFIRLGRSEYQAASFLDGRILSPGVTQTSVPWTEVAAAIAAAQLAERCGYIFHIGHVGSTLLSRLLGSHPGVLSLREPLLLRLFAHRRAADPPGWTEVAYQDRLGGVLKLLSRTFDRGQIAIVKTTSFVSELAAELLARDAAPRALLLLVAPEPYLATMLAGANSRREAAAMTPDRVRRLNARVGSPAWQSGSLSEGEALALAWACEVSALAEAASARTLLMDFDGFLAAPSERLAAALRCFSIDAAPGEVSAILRGPDMRRYSKAPEHAYDAALRRDVLDAARAAHGTEIRRGLRWLERAAADHAKVRAALAFAAGAAHY